MSAGRVRVSLVPPPRPPRLPRGTVAVVIDVLRATTSLSAACAHGAARVVAFAEPAEALAFRDRTPGALACGERGGRRVPGFDLGNSPAEFTRDRVAGRVLAFASTNGSRALESAAECPRRLVACFRNASAVLRVLSSARSAWIVASGKLGEFALEDAVLAGWFAARLAEAGWALDGAEAPLARSLSPRDAQDVRAVVHGCEHGRALSALGAEFAADVERCGALDADGGAHALAPDGGVSAAVPATS